MSKNSTVCHKRSSVVTEGIPKQPTTGQIDYGEIAINYAANGETLFIKNSEDAIVKFKDDKYYQKQLSEKTDKTLSLTYSELVSLRDNSQLIPGQQYRITDYVTTTAQVNARSAGNVFDIIVRADSENKLNEVASAIQHEGDEYFANSNLSAWKIWYCLDNDANRFAWADTTNGKGVIYRMIDEFNNDVPYDFKNIQFYRQWDEDKQLWSIISSSKNRWIIISPDGESIPCYTFSSAGDSSTTEFTDMSLVSSNDVYSNVIKECTYVRALGLNNNCFFGKECHNNTIWNGCQYNTFGNKCHYNTFGKECHHNTFGNYCIFNTVGDGFYENSFGNNCQYNSFGVSCADIYFGDNCSNNSFGNGCNYINFAPDKLALTKYNYYQNNHFGDGCQYICFTGAETASSNAQVQNYNFAQGLQGASNAYLTIDGNRNLAYETKVAKNSNGELKVYCEVDLIK